MRRCKLISPTNLMLERPILSPVAECEYVLFGAKEFSRRLKHWFLFGAIAGAFCMGLLVMLLQAVMRG